MKEEKERHPFYWLMMTGLVILLLLGVALFVAGVILGPNRVFASPSVTI